MKDKTHTKQSGLSEQEKKKLTEEGKAQALSAIQKKIKDIILFNKFVFVNEPPLRYQEQYIFLHIKTEKYIRRIKKIPT